MSKHKKQVDWTLILFISFFLGWLGVDRFFMGQVGAGILKLITFGGFGIWWLIDLILIMSSYNFKNIEWKQSKHKKSLIIFVILLLVVVIIIVSKSDASVPTSSMPKSDAQKEQTIDIFSKSFNDYGKIYCNPDATTLQKKTIFNDYLKGKYVEWTGVVSQISETFGEYTLQVKHCPLTFVTDITIFMRDDQKDTLLQLKQGDQVTYIAKLMSFGEILGLSANDGRVVIQQTNNNQINTPSKNEVISKQDSCQTDKCEGNIFYQCVQLNTNEGKQPIKKGIIEGKCGVEGDTDSRTQVASTEDLQKQLQENYDSVNRINYCTNKCCSDQCSIPVVKGECYSACDQVYFYGGTEALENLIKEYGG